MEWESGQLRFHTNDPYSRRWFYPRYQGGRWHEPAASRWWLEAAREAAIILDVGANLGWFTCLAAAANPRASVIAFEPSAANRQLGRANTVLNGLTNIQWEDAVVGDGETPVAWSEGAPGLPHASNRLRADGPPMTTVALDRYFAGRDIPQLVKIDVEGAEDLVLAGMANLLRNPRLCSILIELHPVWLAERGTDPLSVVRRLEDAGFVLQSFLESGALAPFSAESLAHAGNGEIKLWARRDKVL